VARYNPQQIEPSWQKYWADNKTFKTPDTITGKKLYALDMFPYPSGEGLHVGHPEGYTATDIVARHARMTGTSVLHPMGFDAFGLPAEEYAIKTNTHPRVSTNKNIANFVRQLQELGFSYDWDRQISTTDVQYVRWTQWIFLQLFDTWYDTDQDKGRPISELPIPAEVTAEGPVAVAAYQDEFRLAYQTNALVNWCPNLGTVLANEEVKDGLSERGNHPVERRPLKQWMMRITAYADRLEADLDDLDWSDGVKKLQKDWIGRSTGAEVDFYIGGPDQFDNWKEQRSQSGFTRKPADDVLRVYTTRPDTLFGATYMVISPEHELIESLTTAEHQESVKAYRETAARKSDRDRQDDRATKTGVFSGSHAINPVNGASIPIWIADYVLAGYGTGAIMAVPAHDTRDFQFAQTYDLEIIQVVQPPKDDAGKSKCFAGHGTAINSGEFDGIATAEFKQKIADQLTKSGTGKTAVNYKLRDWLFSRQRFWGEPFPILHELDDDGNKTGVVVGVDETALPVKLPELKDFKPHGRPEPPLEKADDDWLYPVIDGKKYKRETNTMPQWAGSCWYFLRFIDPTNDDVFVDPELEKQWMPVDLYIGGAEHAVLHLLYSRFWHKVLFDRGHLTTKEPFHKLVNQGMILGENEFTGYQTQSQQWISFDQVSQQEDRSYVVTADKSPATQVAVAADDVEKTGDHFVLTANPKIKIANKAYKMSKARGNVVNPSEVVQQYGADSLRLYEMFLGPLEQSKPWNTSGVSGVRNFLDRVWRLVVEGDKDADKNEAQHEIVLSSTVVDTAPDEEQTRVLHQTIKAVTQDIEKLSFNTAIARMMEFANFFTKQSARPKACLEPFVLLLSPFAPHIAEELWRVLGHDETLAYEPWPEFDEALTIESSVEIPVQIMGKIKSRLKVPRGTSKDDLEKLALADEKIAELLAGKKIIKTIVVPDRLVNFVAK
jgi:leucyl-tRNA synthetase